MNKLLILDTETTGTQPLSNSIHQISGYIAEEHEDRIDTIRSFDVRTIPFRLNNVDEEALKVAGVTLETFESYTSPNLVHRDLTLMFGNYVDKFNKSDKFHLLAYNAPFDSQFLRRWFSDCGDKFYGSWFFNPAIDVMTLAGVHLMDSRKGLPNFKLATVANAMGFEVEQTRLHDSMYDVELTLRIYATIKNKQLNLNH